MDDRRLFEQRKESIRNMIYDEEYIPLKFKEMAYLMNVPHKEKEKLKEVLDALLADGSVELTARGKYVKAENENLTGVFTAHPRGFGFVSVEGEPEDTACEAVIEKVKEAGYKKVILRPLMVVAGDHANNDMAGAEEDSWKSMLEASGNFDSVEAQIAGLGRIDAVKQLYVEHTKAAMDSLAK